MEESVDMDHEGAGVATAREGLPVFDTPTKFH